MIAWLLSWFRCDHRDTFLERRDWQGYDVIHTVCSRCNFAQPLVKRTLKEQQHLQGAGPAYTLLKSQGKR